MVTMWKEPIRDYIITDSRKKEAAEIYDALVGRNQKMLVIEGDYGIGKTFLAKCYAQQYSAVYPGGITYCANIREWMTVMERWTETGFPVERQLLVADELTEGDYWSEADKGRLLERFLVLQEHPEHVDVLLIGNPVPQILAQSYPVLTVHSLADHEAQDIIIGRIDAYNQNKILVRNYETIYRYYAYYILQNAEGNPRRIHSILNLLEEELVTESEPDHFPAQPGQGKPARWLEQQKQPPIAAIPSIVDVNGQPLRSGSREYGRIRTDLSCVNEQVLRRLREHPEEIHQMSPREFELFTAALLERMGYEVKLTPQTRDGGVDIYAARKEEIGSFLYLVQCKKKQPDRPVGVQVIRELYGVLQSEKATYASVVTTSYFSRPAREFREQFRHQLSLLDYHEIRDWLHRFT